MRSQVAGARLWAVLQKNVRLKLAHPISTILEFLLPVVFLVILVFILALSKEFDSPNVAYNCGNAFPWYGTSTLLIPSSYELIQCGVKPQTCTSSSYYRRRVELPLGSTPVTFSTTLGFVSSSNGFPFYTLTIADRSTVYSELSLDNPSLPFPTIIQRLTATNTTFAIAPKTKDAQLAAEAERFRDYLQQLVLPADAGTFKMFSNEHQLDHYVTNQDYEDADYRDGKVAMGVVISAVDRATHQWSYVIRMNYTYERNDDDDTVGCLYGCKFKYTVPSTSQSTNDLNKPQSMDYLYGYSYSGFLTIQQVVDSYILLQETNQTVAFQASLSLMPTKAFESNDFWQVVDNVVGVFLMLAFLFPVAQFVRHLVVEKETYRRATMKLMGLSDWAYDFSWLISLSVQVLAISALITAVLGPTLFSFSSLGLIFLYFFTFSLATMGFCFLMAAIFRLSKVAAVIAPLIFFACYLPYYAVVKDEVPTSSKIAACLLAPTCFALGANVIGEFEGGAVGIQPENTNQVTRGITFNVVISMIIIDFVIYSLLAWYLDKVLNWEHGRRLPFYFLCSPAYWNGQDQPKQSAVQPFEHDEWTFDVEPVPYELRSQVVDRRCLRIMGLTKRFKTALGEKIAVNNLNLELYENQITVLLGHNGAGKSTLISLLTGTLSPTSGTAWIRGKNIHTNMPEIRRDLGVCPQHNALYPELTVMQHLTMFATFKGVRGRDVRAAAEKMIQEVGLTEKTHVVSRKLSGGMKRKLCLAIALIGDSGIVILDEPTSGMDPYSRRAIWNILQRNKRGRVILLTTHFMDEADYLGDRIAILARGKLKCCGSSMFLKNRYGVGYTLTIDKAGNADHDEEIHALLQEFVPRTQLVGNAGSELIFRLPFLSNERYALMLSTLDTRKGDLGILSYGIGLTTLEEVFLRIGRDDTTPGLHREYSAETKDADDDVKREDEDDKHVLESGHTGAIEMVPMKQVADETKPSVRPKSWNSKQHLIPEVQCFMVHFGALFRKRMIYAKRDKQMFICQLLLPVIFMVLGMGLLQVEPDLSQPKLKLTPNIQNDQFQVHRRNPVPMNGMGTLGQALQARFNNEDIRGYAVPMESAVDQFSGCAQGAAPLTNMSNYLIANRKPRSEKGASRYGAITIAGTSTTTNLQYNVMVNGSSVHGAAIYPNLLHTALLQELLQDSGARINVYNHPLPRTYRQQEQDAALSAFTLALLLLIAFAFIPVTYMSFVVKEHEFKSKEQQLISGVSLLAYWTSLFAWDVLSYLVPVAFVVILWFAFSISTTGPAVYIILLLYGPAIIAFTYATSFAFSSHAAAENAALFIGLFTGFCLTVVSLLLVASSTTASISQVIRYVFRIFPTYCLGDALLYLSFCLRSDLCPSVNDDGPDFMNPIGPMNWNISAADMVFLAILTVFYFSLVFVFEYFRAHPIEWRRKKLERVAKEVLVKDDDVERESERVQSGAANTDVVRLENLRKVYPDETVAVQSLSFGIPVGECFGFLGNNGAGKSTTFNMLCGELRATAGTAVVAGYDIHQNRSQVRRVIGYCPQFDGLFDLLTVREHLYFYARIKCLPRDVLADVVRHLLQELDLVNFEFVTVRALSGGDKRRLTVAIALIGQPPIVFLDEPSTGMDPIARRYLWDAIARISTAEGTSSVILSTHAMEEAEALCTRIAIMVDGELRCIGSAQHLKSKFGNGHEVDLRTRLPTDAEINELVAKIVHWRFISVGSLDGRLAPPFDACARALGNVSRAAQISADGSGAALFAEVQTVGALSVRAFCEWWLAMDFADRVHDFMENNFDQCIPLVEQSSQRVFRYRVGDPDVSLGDLFYLLEKSKVHMCVESYSIGQTTLEQVFDQIAAKDYTEDQSP